MHRTDAKSCTSLIVTDLEKDVSGRILCKKFLEANALNKYIYYRNMKITMLLYNSFSFTNQVFLIQEQVLNKLMAGIFEIRNAYKK